VKYRVGPLDEFMSTLTQILPNAQQIPTSSPIQWSHPPVAIIKLNWDSFLDRRKQLICVSVIVRNSDGKVMASMCSVQQYISNPAIAEVYGAQ
jgi:hypothetical protein